MDDDVEESSSKRRERLLALRSAANASTASAPPPAPAPSLLPDPDLAGDQPVPRASQPHRFDYYTNPAAAFSSSYSGGGSNPTYSHKRKSPPAFYAPRPAPPPPQPYGSSRWQSLMQFQTPMPGHQVIAPGAPPHRGPHFTCPGRGSYPISPNFGFRHTNSSQGDTIMNYAPRGSSYSSYGRGRGQNCYRSTGSRGGSGSGRAGFWVRSGCLDQRINFKCMVDDPWMDLQPIVGNILIRKDASSAKEESKHSTIV